MAMPNSAEARFAAEGRHTGHSPKLSGVDVMREGRVEPFLHAQPTLSSAIVGWSGLALEDYSVPALLIPRHEHVENFLHVVLRGSAKYLVSTGGKTLRYVASPGTTFILPRGTVDELLWRGPTHRIAVAIHPRLLVTALDETAHERDIELTQHWNLTEPQIMAVLLAMTTDLREGSPAGRLYGEALCNALAVYLLNRYAVRRYGPEPRATRSGCRHEPALFCRIVQKEHRPDPASVHTFAEDRAGKEQNCLYKLQYY